MRSDSSRVGTALEMIEAGYAMLSDEALDTQTLLDLLAVQSRLEALSWKAPAIAHKLIARLRAEADPKALGAKNVATRWPPGCASRSPAPTSASSTQSCWGHASR